MSTLMTPNQTQDDISIMLGNRRKKRPSHIPLFSVENEECQLRQRPRANTGDSLMRRREVSPEEEVSTICDKLNEAFITPPSHHLSQDDSGFQDTPAIIHSDPDWYLRPQKLSVHKSLKKRSSRRFLSGSSTTPSSDSFWSRTLRWCGLAEQRPNYTDTRRSSSKVNMKMETLLGSLIFIIVIASLLFSVLISMRFFVPGEVELNGKYRSIQFASEQLSRYQQDQVSRSQESSVQTDDQAQVEHIPRDVDTDFVDEEEEAKDDASDVDDFTDYEDPSTFRGKSQDEVITPDHHDASNTVVVSDNLEVIKKMKSKRSKNLNPLKPKKTTSAVKRRPVHQSGKVEESMKPVADSIENDYDEPPSTFRGKQPEVIDLMDSLR